MVGETGVRSILKDNAARLIPVLVAVAVAPVFALVADVPAWASALAAAFAALSLVLIVLWIGRPWSEWMERRGRRLAAVVAPLVAAGVVLIAGVIATPPVVDPNAGARLILFDTSRDMRQPLPEGSGSRLDDAKEQMGDYLAGIIPSEQLGLATFGGGCDADPPVAEDVSIAQDRGEEIAARLDELVPTDGDRNLVRAVRYASSLLQPLSETRSSTLVIVTSGLDGCGDDVQGIFADLANLGIVLDWYLIGLGFSSEDKDRAGRLTGGHVLFADTPEELGEALNEALCRDAIRDEFRPLSEVLFTRLPDRLNETGAALDAGEVADAQATLVRMQDLLKQGQGLLAELDAEGSLRYLRDLTLALDQVFQPLSALASELETEIAFRQEHPGELTGQTQAEWNERIERYNALIERFEQEGSEVVDEIESLLESGCRPKEG